MKLSYYPGCALHGTGVEFDVSTREVCRRIGIELEELDDWSCCGASAAHSLNRELAVALPARDLATAARRGLDLAVVCAACYHNLKKADHALRHDSDLAERIATAHGIDYPGGVNVRHLLHVFNEPDVLETVRAAVVKPLQGLTFGCYYGCLITRPPEIMGCEADADNPQSMETLVAALGGQSVDWSYKTDCCGAAFSLGRSDIAVGLMAKIFRNAIDSGIEAVVVACPLCHANLDTRQKQVGARLGCDLNVPIFYFTELMGLAMDLRPVRDVLKKHLTSVRPALEKLHRA